MEIAFLKYLFTKRNKSSIIILRVKNNFERYGRMISVKEATKNYINGGKGKTTMPLGRMFVLAFLAGMFIALAGTAATIASSTVTNSSVAKVITSLVFPAGLAMVIINGTELFTGNNLLIMPVLSKNITVGQMLKNWLVVYIGNFTGSIL